MRTLEKGIGTLSRSTKKEELEGKDARNDQGQQDVANHLWMKRDELQALRKWDGTVAAMEVTDRDGVATFWAGF